jgi:hypothetical protein
MVSWTNERTNERTYRSQHVVGSDWQLKAVANYFLLKTISQRDSRGSCNRWESNSRSGRESKKAAAAGGETAAAEEKAMAAAAGGEERELTGAPAAGGAVESS